VPPYGRLEVHDPQYILTFVIFLIIGILMSELGSRLRAQVQQARQREQETAALYALSQSMALAQDTNASLDTALSEINLLFDAEAIVLRRISTGKLEPYPDRTFSEHELDAARWALEHQQPAGAGTSAFPDAARFYLPLFTAQRTLGVLSLRFNDPAAKPPTQQRLLEMFAGQIALALDHAKLSEQAEQARLLEASDRFRNALLSSLSHDLRTPLASILGSATSLLDKDARLDVSTRRELLETIRDEATRLNRFVANLLNMTRLESGSLKPQRDWHSVEEVVGSALAHAGTNGHTVKLDLAPNLPLVPFDFVLVEQVLINLLDNAYKFSPATEPIEIAAQLQDHFLEVRVANRGVTIPNGELEHIFEKFYRLPNGSGSAIGMGLGLSIAKGIVEAHDGTIFAKQRADGGTEIIFRLPLRELERSA
jgi:two-component system, OmpR family, sensor histidine kinase KdpD